MDLSKDESEKIGMQEDMLKGNITQMCLSNNYEELELNRMIATDRIDTMYKILRDHLVADYDKEMSE